jgi:tetratricopeptide (TPR) repeat protein
MACVCTHSRLRWRWALAAVCALLALSGCWRDPAVKKQNHVEKGDGYFAQQRYTDAALEYKKALELDPQSADTCYKLGMSYSRLGHWPEAAQSLANAVKLSPENSDARLRLAQALLAIGYLPEARHQAREVLTTSSHNADAHVLLGQIQMQLRDYSGAMLEFRIATQPSPKSAVAYGNLALAQLLDSRQSDAEANFHAAVSLGPDDAANYINLANYYRLDGRQGDAEATLQEGMKKISDAMSLKIALADLWFAEGRSGEAAVILHEIEMDKNHPKGELEVADFYAQRGLYEDALKRYLDLVPERTEDPIVLRKLIDCYLKLGRWSEAERWIEAGRRRQPQSPDWLLYRSQAELGQKRFSGAITDLQNAIQRNPSRVDFYDQLGKTYFATGDFVAAKSALGDALRLQPNDVPALLAMANISLQENNASLALQYAQQILAAHLWDAEAHLVAGDAWLLKGSLQHAREEFQLALKTGTRNGEAQERIGRVLAAQGKNAEAEKAYNAALRSSPANQPALAGMSELLLRQGRGQEARARIDKQIQAAPRSPGLLLLKGRFCQQQADSACAKTSFQRALELAPESAEAHLALADFYAASHRPQQAEQEYLLAERAHPASELLLIYMHLAALYESQGEFEKAQQVYREALGRDPNFAPAQNNLAWSYLQHGGQLDEALELAQSASTEQPNNPAISDTLAWAFYKKKMYSAAVALSEFSVAQNPQNANFQFHLGLACLASGKKHAGRNALQAAVRLGLSGEDGETARSELQKTP